MRRLTKLMQKKLADGNSVSEAALGSMATVRSFDAAESELEEFEKHMSKYLHLNNRSAVLYIGYCSFVTAVPELVFAIVGRFVFWVLLSCSAVYSWLSHFFVIRILQFSMVACWSETET